MKTKKDTEKVFNITKLSRKILSFCCILAFIFSIVYVDGKYQFVDYIKRQNQETFIYEDYYVNPNDVSMTNNGEKKNLIYIVLESMENTYAAKTNGGCQEVSCIPNLESLAAENVSFSNSEQLGGFKNTYGTTCTIMALLALTSGIPYQFPLFQEDMRFRTSFASNLTTMGDVLADFGYNQMFLCGSDAEFAGRELYFKTHGDYEISDYYSAIEEGYIDDDYKVWWGYEDEYLYKIAKDKLINLSSQVEPFNLTMLTVDTHFYEGYRCNLCENDFENETANIVSCADKQLAAFINWCKQQDFYEDTLIVICGDHERMDKFLVDGSNSRTIYNCFINSSVKASSVKNRIFTPMDMFPTIMAGLGFEWNGDRLGLGTNLFSNKKTLAEELGFDNFNDELSKKSKYYIDNFY